MQSKLHYAVGVAIAAAAIPSAAHADAYAQLETGLDSLSVDGAKASGIAYGLAAGYDIPIAGRIFLGVEAAAHARGAKACSANAVIPGAEICAGFKRDAAITAHAGTQIGERGKLYVLAGYSNARLRSTVAIPGQDLVATSQNLGGYRMGAGYRQDLGRGLFAKAEYRYSNYAGDTSRHQGVARRLRSPVGVNYDGR